MKSAVVVLLFVPALAFSIGQPRYVEDSTRAGSFALVSAGKAAAIYVDPADWPGVLRAAGDLRADVARVTGITPEMAAAASGGVVIAGTIGRSAAIGRLVREKKIDVSGIAGKWETFLVQVVDGNLVIAGSDKRGTIYGIYDLSEQIGVSPWYWWADVPVRHRDALFVRTGKTVEGPPAVKYRGIFLNDEAPALSGWVKEKYGTYNSGFYKKVFELVLRMKGNYLWPAMWGNAFNEDDPQNPKIADEWGIVMGTTHHEPMLRAQQEWKRHGQGPWDYTKNDEMLRKFWAEGVARNKAYESIISIGMRGDGDMPMARGDANIPLLESIVADQRKIIAEQVNPNPAAVPQLWALYKEVQEYYEKGMRVPDDVTLLWSDDNWGNIRRLPTPDERKRSGGAGIYYHFDYVGGPRNYKWIDTNPIPKVNEQMTLAWKYGADRIWIVNVGDLKPMEFPIEYFLSLAWNPARWPKERTGEFTRLWAEREFGPAHAAGIADLTSRYLKYNGRRKPELIDPATYSLVNYDEADRVVGEFHAVVDEAEKLSLKLPENARDAFFELVLHPAKANSQVTELYVTAGRNRLYAEQGRASTNDYATKVKALFQADADLTKYYNEVLAGGKWSHMMDQTHIGYTMWQEPRQNNMPAVKELELPAAPELGAWAPGDLAFDVFNKPRRYIDVFNKGRGSVEFTAKASAPWIVLSQTHGTIEKDARIRVAVDWSNAPKGTSEGSVSIGDKQFKVTAFSPAVVPSKAFVEADGYVSIEAEHFTAKHDAGALKWEKIEDYGRTLSAMTTTPSLAESVMPPAASPYLEYRMYLFTAGPAEVQAMVAPTLNFVPGRGLRFAVSFDDQPPQVVDALEHNTQRDWEGSVRDSIRTIKSTHTIAAPGYHTLKIWMVDPALVLEKLVVNTGGLKPSYLGPPESYYH